ncbi:hypothetical protein PFICI_06130 [Pestalotiopsis fici W106-1]|uniref:DUF6594 domain-containing protein n=1 Tax=Pestalotiopsis fici (strain W106-1 / CGMCC3.15140) TaxID=1229662 RepID=W3X4S6_PESFW|nr:uncharacterized protein PFICI_06130 [Pestalotiopsis fici W106-1]ETS81128.1 hypothetical protein PFICI_06130 [Pestalotiopsis fici W106-1]
MQQNRYCLPQWNRSQPSGATRAPVKKIEDYRAGYPRFTALLSAHQPYLICRPFTQLRARLLLLKQDRLAVLEQTLEQIDQDEVSPLFLGKSRCDRNTDRIALLAEIDSCLADYDRFVERTNRTLSFSPAEPRDVESLQNWLNGTGCVAREERAYLSQRELISVAPTRDNARVQFEAWIEDKLIRFYRGFRKSHLHDISNDPNVYIYSGPVVQRAARALLLSLMALLLLLPVVICNATNIISARIIVMMVSTICYLVAISELTQPKTMELILAGATYATVLTVFVSGTSEL